MLVELIKVNSLLSQDTKIMSTFSFHQYMAIIESDQQNIKALIKMIAKKGSKATDVVTQLINKNQLIFIARSLR